MLSGAGLMHLDGQVTWESRASSSPGSGRNQLERYLQFREHTGQRVSKKAEGGFSVGCRNKQRIQRLLPRPAGGVQTRHWGHRHSWGMLGPDPHLPTPSLQTGGSDLHSIWELLLGKTDTPQSCGKDTALLPKNIAQQSVGVLEAAALHTVTGRFYAVLDISIKMFLKWSRRLWILLKDFFVFTEQVQKHRVRLQT